MVKDNPCIFLVPCGGDKSDFLKNAVEDTIVLEVEKNVYEK